MLVGWSSRHPQRRHDHSNLLKLLCEEMQNAETYEEMRSAHEWLQEALDPHCLHLSVGSAHFLWLSHVGSAAGVGLRVEYWCVGSAHDGARGGECPSVGSAREHAAGLHCFANQYL
jgi:hypothetical protein